MFTELPEDRSLCDLTRQHILVTIQLRNLFYENTRSGRIWYTQHYEYTVLIISSQRVKTIILLKLKYPPYIPLAFSHTSHHYLHPLFVRLLSTSTLLMVFLLSPAVLFVVLCPHIFCVLPLPRVQTMHIH